LRANDVIVAIDGEAITGVFDLRDRLDEHEGGDQVTLVVQRGNREVTLTVTLGNGLGM
jgi:serine protease Do